jgi:hypothetical protein
MVYGLSTMVFLSFGLFSAGFAKFYKYTIEIPDKAFVESKIQPTFAARKRDSGAFCKSKLINKKIKFAQEKKVLTFAVPKERGAQQRKYRKRFSV